MEIHDNVSPESMTVEQALAALPILAAQLQDQDLQRRNIVRMGNLLVTCFRENRPPTMEEINEIGRHMLPKPHLVAKAVRGALKEADHG